MNTLTPEAAVRIAAATACMVIDTLRPGTKMLTDHKTMLYCISRGSGVDLPELREFSAALDPTWQSEPGRAGPDRLTIDGELYFVRRAVGQPTSLVQASTGHEVILPPGAEGSEHRLTEYGPVGSAPGSMFRNRSSRRAHGSELKAPHQTDATPPSASPASQSRG